MKEQFFKDKKFLVSKGSTHPEYSYHTFELEEHDFRNKYWNIKENDVVLDIGASYGSYSLTACAMGATVYSFEPETTIFNDLQKNIQINNWGNRCFASNVALWDSVSTIDMKLYAPHWPSDTITSNYKTITIDLISQLYNFKKIDWIKIDVEGAEENVIKGALNTLKKFKPNLIVECHIFLNNQLLNNVKSLISPYYYIEEINRDPCIMLLATSKESKNE